MQTLFLIAIVILVSIPTLAKSPEKIYFYNLKADPIAKTYDESLAVTCMQGIINRKEPVLWINPENPYRTDYWKDIMSKDNRWLQGKEWIKIETIDELRKFAGNKIKGIIVWDPNVPATVNVATTVAGAEDLIVLSPEMAEEKAKIWNLKIKHDLRGKFDGSETGSPKNDAYRWAVREYLAKGKCSKEFMFLFEDTWNGKRDRGDLTYVLVRDWVITNKGFVFDLSPWGDEAPKDDPNQTLGTDLETYLMILSVQLAQTKGNLFTEFVGFFDFQKYSSEGGGSHEPIPTEWETVRIISPYNCFQNTVAVGCYNQSFHRFYKFEPRKQKVNKNPEIKLENKTYVCIMMADYDSTTTIYEFLPNHWSDPRRGEMPLSWGINPNLMDSYPDIIDYFSDTATANDFIVADATCAGYFNPTRIDPKYMDLFTKHNKKYYDLMDIDVSPMILDVDDLTPVVKDAYLAFSPRGIGVCISKDKYKTITFVQPEIWKESLPIINLDGAPDVFLKGEFFEKGDYKVFADWLYNEYFSKLDLNKPNFHYIRIVWSSPGAVIDGMKTVKEHYPQVNLEVVDPYTFFGLFKENMKEK